MKHRIAPKKALITNRGIIAGDYEDPTVSVEDLIPRRFKGTDEEALKVAKESFAARVKNGTIMKAGDPVPESVPVPVAPEITKVPTPPRAPAAPAKGGATAKGMS